MGTVISNLKARFGVDTTDFKNGLKDGERAVDSFKTAAGDSVSQLADMFGVNMGAVGNALESARRSMNFLSQSFTGAAKGGNVLTISLKVLKTALISTGIGALVVLLGSVIAYFTKSGEGADKFSKILRQVKAVVNEVIDRLAIFGKGLFQLLTGRFKEGWETMTGAFKGMGKEIAENVRQAGALADAMDELEDREIALITVQGARRRSIEELREAAKDLDLTEEERIRKLDQVKGTIAAYYADEIRLAQQRYAQKKKEIDLAASDPTDEQRRELAELENRINELYAERASELRGLSREYNSLQKSIAAALQASKDETIKGMEKISSLLYQEQGKKLFDISGIKSQLAEVKEAVIPVMNEISSAVTEVVNTGFNDLATGLGEFFGKLMTGEAGIKDFGLMVAGVFADMAIQVGKIAIATGIATLGIKAALESLNPVLAIAGGAALVALGYAVKSSMSKAASGSAAAGSASSLGSSANTYDLRNIAVKPQAIQLGGEVKLRAEGRDLVAVMNLENNRKNTNT